jgi:hypothetical protein
MHLNAIRLETIMPLILFNFRDALRKITLFIRVNRFLLLMMLIFVCIREGMIIFDMWTIKDGGDLPESLIAGNLAFDLIDGNWRGWPTYLYVTRGCLGNEPMVGIFAIPLYILFGNSLFVLCQVQILSSLAIMLLMYIFCKKYFGIQVAKLAALLLVCFPMRVQSYLIYPNYLYFDNSFYTLLAFLLFTKMIERPKTKTNMLCPGLLGFVSGIGLVHTQIYFVTLGCILFFWCISKGKLFFAKKEFFVFILGLIIGAIPIFYFGINLFIDFFRDFFSGQINYSYDSGVIANNYWTSLGLMSIGFWPLSNIFLSKISSQVVTMLGILLLLSAVFWAKFNKKLSLAFALVVLYTFSFMLIAFIFKGSVEYYFHPLLVPVTIILSVVFYNIQTRLFVKNYSKVVFYTVLCFICFSNLYAIIRHFDLKHLMPRLKKQLSINGCCFYWPSSYSPPGGLKSDLTLKVEALATETYFGENLPDESAPKKKIYISDIRRGEYILASPESYVIFGKDVSFTGLETLAKEIKMSVPEEARPFAYGGLAVYYINDNWLRDLLKKFKAGIIEKNIPEEYQRYFYMELARKICSRYQGHQVKIDKLFGVFEGKQKEWMLNTQLKSL